MEYVVLAVALFLSTTTLMALKKFEPAPAPIRLKKSPKQDT